MERVAPITKAESQARFASRCGTARFSHEQVYAMRTDYRSGLSMRALRDKYKCGIMCVSDVLHGTGAYKNI